MDRTGRTSSAAARSVRITSAQSSHSERIRGRQTRYLVSMGVRTVCFVLAVVTDGTLRWVLIIGAVVLPYFAVIVANASGEIDRDAPAPFVDDSRPMLEAGPAAGAHDGPTEGDHDGTTDGDKSAQNPSGQ